MSKKNCKCKMCKNVKKGLKEIAKGEVTKPFSIDEWEHERIVWQNIHPIRYKMQQVYYSIRRFFIRIKDFFLYDIKHFIQRGKRGWSNCDWYNLPFYTSKVLVGMLKKLKNDGHGLPTWIEKKTEKEAVKEWDNILDNIIYTFETAVKIGDGDIDYMPTTDKNAEKYRNIYRKIHRKLNKKHPDVKPSRVLTEKESKRLEKGFDLFKKWYFHLWD